MQGKTVKASFVVSLFFFATIVNGSKSASNIKPGVEYKLHKLSFHGGLVKKADVTRCGPYFARQLRSPVLYFELDSNVGVIPVLRPVGFINAENCDMPGPTVTFSKNDESESEPSQASIRLTHTERERERMCLSAIE